MLHSRSVVFAALTIGLALIASSALGAQILIEDGNDVSDWDGSPWSATVSQSTDYPSGGEEFSLEIAQTHATNAAVAAKWLGGSITIADDEAVSLWIKDNFEEQGHSIPAANHVLTLTLSANVYYALHTGAWYDAALPPGYPIEHSYPEWTEVTVAASDPWWACHDRTGGSWVITYGPLPAGTYDPVTTYAVFQENCTGNEWVRYDNAQIIPEPATVTLVGVGGLGLITVLLLRRRRG